MKYYQVLRSRVPFIQTYADAEVDEAWRPHHVADLVHQRRPHVVSGPPVRSYQFTPVIHGQSMWEGRQWAGQDVSDRPAQRRAIPHAARNAVRLAARGHSGVRQVIGACLDRAIAGFETARAGAENLLAADHEEHGPGGPAHEIWQHLGGPLQSCVTGACCPHCACEGNVVGAPSGNPEEDLSFFTLGYLHRADAQRRVGIPVDTTSPRSVYFAHHGLL